MRPRVRSYGDNSTRTRSPGRMRMKFMRNLPLMWASTRWPFSSSTANMVLGSGSMTVPSTSIASRLATGYVRPFLTRSVGPGGPTHERVAYQRWSFPATGRSCHGQDLRTVLGHRDRVLEMGRHRAVGGNDGPVVGLEPGVMAAECEHRLDRQAQPGLELAARPARPEVGYLRLLVHRGADPVAHELADDAEPRPSGDRLDRRRDVLDVVARGRRRDAGHHRFAGQVDE